MPKPTPEFISRIQAEGTTAEKRVENGAIHKKAAELAAKLPPPPNRQVYVSNLLGQTLRGDIEEDAFKEFVRMTNTYQEVEVCYPRVRLLARKKDKG